MGSAEIIFVSASYLMDTDTDMVTDIKCMIKFKIKSDLNEYGYEVDIQRIHIL
jgi:hypothetical protein